MGFIGAEGETRQGFALSMLRKILLYVRAPLPDGKPSHMDERVLVSLKNIVKQKNKA